MMIDNSLIKRVNLAQLKFSAQQQKMWGTAVIGKRAVFVTKGRGCTTVREVDGCLAGWLSISLNLNGGRPFPKVFPSDAGAVLSENCAVTAIDIPIGLFKTELWQLDQKLSTQVVLFKPWTLTSQLADSPNK